MSNQDDNQAGRGFLIQPSGHVVADLPQYTDTALTNVVAMHGANINSFRQAVWARYAAMLFANSVLIAFANTGGQTVFQNLIGPVFGLALCIVWLAMLRVDREYLFIRVVDASRFMWTHLGPDANVFRTMTEETRSQRGIYRLALMVIILFYLLYILSFAYHGGYLAEIMYRK